MKQLWSDLLGRFPELENLPPEDGGRVLVIATARTLSDRKVKTLGRIQLIFQMLIFSAIVTHVIVAVATSSTVPYFGASLSCSIGILLPTLGFNIFSNRIRRNYFNNAVKHLGAPQELCLHCDYDLRSSDSPACPECGRDKIWRIGSEKLFQDQAQLQSQLPVRLHKLCFVPQWFTASRENRAMVHLPKFLQEALKRQVSQAPRIRLWELLGLIGGMMIMPVTFAIALLFGPFGLFKNSLFSWMILDMFWLAGGVLGFIFSQYHIAKIRRPILSQVLLQRGVRPKICLRCGYDLQGATSDSCPECGEAIAPIEPPPPKQAPET